MKLVGALVISFLTRGTKLQGGPGHFIPHTRNETAGGALVISFLTGGTKLQGGPWSFYFLADCGVQRGQWSLAVGRWATFEKDQRGPPNTVLRCPAPELTDCPVVNSGYSRDVWKDTGTHTRAAKVWNEG